ANGGVSLASQLLQGTWPDGKSLAKANADTANSFAKQAEGLPISRSGDAPPPLAIEIAPTIPDPPPDHQHLHNPTLINHFQ
ncbi:hypothetical protein, partial [Pseudomonas sp. OTU5201]|uniref:hypothetical protein n=1 Tax=Pseudomonas sp. OTU5201 TaxID=3043850 RepID=UPI00313BF017